MVCISKNGSYFDKVFKMFFITEKSRNIEEMVVERVIEEQIVESKVESNVEESDSRQVWYFEFCTIHFETYSGFIEFDRRQYEV